jgi:hypothetical protein
VKLRAINEIIDTEAALCELALEVLERQRSKHPGRVFTHESKPGQVCEHEGIAQCSSELELSIAGDGRLEVGRDDATLCAGRRHVWCGTRPLWMALLRVTSTGQSVEERTAAKTKKASRSLATPSCYCKFW